MTARCRDATALTAAKSVRTQPLRTPGSGYSPRPSAQQPSMRRVMLIGYKWKGLNGIRRGQRSMTQKIMQLIVWVWDTHQKV